MARRALIAVVLMAVVLVAAVLVTHEGRLYAEELGTRIGEQATGAPAAALTDLSSIDELKAAFNDASGQPRLILLFSPT